MGNDVTKMVKCQSGALCLFGQTKDARGGNDLVVCGETVCLRLNS